MWRWIDGGGAIDATSVLFGAGFTIAVCGALGELCFGKTLKQWPERFITGAALLSLLIFVLGTVQLAYPAVFLGLGAGVLLIWLKRVDLHRPKVPSASKLLMLAFGAYFLLYFFNAMAPEASPDGAAYHLGLVARWLREHGFHPATRDMYASLSEGMEMLFLFAFAFGKHSAAAVVHFAFLPALVWQMAIYARRNAFPVLGACAALLVFATPVVGKDATSAYNDVGLACVEFSLFAAVQNWDEECNDQLLIPIGLLAGFGYAIKYTGAVGIVYAAGYVLWRARQARPVAMVIAASAVMVLPWVVRDWIWVGNPVAPFFNHQFPNPYVTTWFENDYRQYFKLYDLPSRWAIPWAAAVKGQLAGVVGPVFLLAPISLLALRRREGRRLLFAAGVFGSTYFSNIGARFLIPPLPFLALAMMLGIANRAAATGLAMVHAVVSWPALIPRYAEDWTWRIHNVPVAYALRLRPEADYLHANLPQYGIDRLLDRATEPGATVLTYQAIPEAYTSRKVLVEYESESNHTAALTLWTGFLPEWSPTWRAGFSFPRQMLRGIRMVQTADGKSQWRVHELRAFDGSMELSRSGWKAVANPFPWGSEKMLDGNPVTFWECGDALRAGNYVEAEFAAPAEMNSVVIETSPNQPGLRLELYGETGGGEWKRLASEPDVFTAAVPDLRRGAVEDLKRRGIGYVLLFDKDRAAAAVRESGAAAGMVAIGESDGARLYRLQ